MMKPKILILATVFATTVSTHAQSNPPPGGDTGEWITLPSLELDKSIKRLTPIGQQVQAAANRIEPVIARYEAEPTEKNRKELEGQISILMKELSSGLSKASSEREQVQFALEDLGRYSGRSKRRLDRLTTRLTKIVGDSEKQRDEALRAAQAAAVAYKSASPETKVAARRRLDASMRELKHLTQLSQMHGRFAGDVDSMTDGVSILLEQFAQLGSEIDGLFDELELGSDLLRSVAEQREITSELLNIYESFIGEGRELKTAIEELNTLRGKLGLVRGVVTRLSDVGEFTAQVQQIRSLNERVAAGAPNVEAIEGLVDKLERGENPFMPSTLETPPPPAPSIEPAPAPAPAPIGTGTPPKPTPSGTTRTPKPIDPPSSGGAEVQPVPLRRTGTPRTNTF